MTTFIRLKTKLWCEYVLECDECLCFMLGEHLDTTHLWKWITLGTEHVKCKQLFFSFTGYHLNSASLTGEQKKLVYHRYVEAFKFANGLKKHIRDPQFSSEKVRFTK